MAMQSPRANEGGEELLKEERTPREKREKGKLWFDAQEMRGHDLWQGANSAWSTYRAKGHFNEFPRTLLFKINKGPRYIVCSGLASTKGHVVLPEIDRGD